ILGNLAAGGRNTEIRGTRGVDIQADQAKRHVERNASGVAIALIPPQHSDPHGTTNQNSYVEADAGAVVYASPRDTDQAALDAAGLTTRDGFNLALFVQAELDNEDDADHNDPLTGKIRNIQWDADVVIAPGPNPELIVDQAGKVVRATNITVNDIPNP